MKKITSESRSVTYKDKIITYILTYKNVKNINLRIKPDAKIYVSANNKVSTMVIDNFVLSKADFILKAVEKYEEHLKYAEKPKQYISGESIKFLGKDLRIKVIYSTEERIESDGVYLYFYLKQTNDFNKKQRLFLKWHKEQCEDILSTISKEVYTKFKKYNVDYPQIKFREMTSRWGSCQPKRGIITLNKRLIETPIICIEYVVLHEFCHFIHPNHSKEFYNFVQMLMPDWKERKVNLERNCYKYL